MKRDKEEKGKRNERPERRREEGAIPADWRRWQVSWAKGWWR